MTPAKEIVERCGGPKRVAEWLGISRNGVQRWGYDHPRGNSNRVPPRHWGALIEQARAHGVTITPDELMPADVIRAVKAGGKRSGASA